MLELLSSQVALGVTNTLFATVELSAGTNINVTFDLNLTPQCTTTSSPSLVSLSNQVFFRKNKSRKRRCKRGKNGLLLLFEAFSFFLFVCCR